MKISKYIGRFETMDVKEGSVVVRTSDVVVVVRKCVTSYVCEYIFILDDNGQKVLKEKDKFLEIASSEVDMLKNVYQIQRMLFEDGYQNFHDIVRSTLDEARPVSEKNMEWLIEQGLR
jgi:hypothetical protein